MNHLDRCVRGAERVVVALAFGLSVAAAASAAEPSLEQVKFESGLSFQEGAGVGRIGGDSAVQAGKSGSAKPALTFSAPAKGGKTEVPSPDGGTPPGGKGPFGRRALVGAGSVLGMIGANGAAALAGLGVLALTGPLGFGLLLGGLALGGAAAGGISAYRSGKRGRALAAGAALGAAGVPAVVTFAGKAVGEKGGTRASAGVSKFFGWLSTKF